MIKTILLILLGLFFILNGINHLINTHTYKEYADKKGLISPRLMVKVSGIALIFGGLSIATGYFLLIGIIGLSLFLVVASFTIHQFWKESNTEKRLLEGMHFAKNMAILTELIYIAYS
ncbi:DoxX family protein [Mangrovimonas sp. AS39]|uniref:DoxX family protein n=1 Tax=Mangrovimonas futianensis TaxID=2895523 RepID=UPI001E357069|nr:DoxX family protein [Mangrovimonas futianensis]MCF1191014.1 DoxX family protein [Mangrovimonas futianensis]MCF1194709.1 DoxX family protein [Mangrovimonas futianensis]